MHTKRQTSCPFFAYENTYRWKRKISLGGFVRVRCSVHIGLYIINLIELLLLVSENWENQNPDIRLRGADSRDADAVRLNYDGRGRLALGCEWWTSKTLQLRLKGTHSSRGCKVFLHFFFKPFRNSESFYSEPALLPKVVLFDSVQPVPTRWIRTSEEPEGWLDLYK